MRLSVVLVVLGFVVLPAAGGDLKEEFHVTFAGGRPSTPALELVGPDAARRVRWGAAGMRITFSPGDSGPVGARPRFRIRGDFEVTLRYELLRVEAPLAGSGAGVLLIARGGDQGSLVLSHLRQVGGREVYAAQHPVPGAHQGAFHPVQYLPAKAKSGQLRLARTGDTVHYLIAPGNSGGFEEVAEVSFGTSDLVDLRVAADSGGSFSGLEVVLRGLSIRAEALPNQIAGTEREPAGWGLWLLASTSLLIAGLGAWWVLHRRRGLRALAANKENRQGR